MNEPEYYSHYRSEIVAAVPTQCSRILSVGCGFGVTEATFVKRGAEVWGVEREPKAAAEAQNRLTHVVCQDAESAAEQCPDGHFDCLIMADILEHLMDPWAALTRYRRKLRPGGILVVSLPNVRYLGVVLPLTLLGRWDYVDEGVLDRTHLRFFTARSITSLITKSGFSGVQMRPRLRGRGRIFGFFSAIQHVYYGIPILRDVFAKQYIVRAVLNP